MLAKCFSSFEMLGFRTPSFGTKPFGLRGASAANCAEGAGRVSRADKARAFTVARGECVEAAAAIEIAALLGDASAEDAHRVAVLADRVVAMLTRLILR